MLLLLAMLFYENSVRVHALQMGYSFKLCDKIHIFWEQQDKPLRPTIWNNSGRLGFEKKPEHIGSGFFEEDILIMPVQKQGINF